LSPALLSKIERGRLFPTLPTLLRIALVFSVGLEHFFAGTREKPLIHVMRRTERVRLPERQGVRHAAFQFESLDFRATERRFNSYYAEFLPVEGAIATHTHPGVEFLYVLRGTLTVQAADAEHKLATGDSMYFDATLPHGYRRHGSKPCSAVVITA
jgi:mannose-6-phosphate isomerase-like protein (cupin superfamily)